ncbi:MAG TPA: hypothetical protein VLV86_03325, partial [Vicinamibacterales bacterium]|nr:hypothetical protein [Vicinamibacterales bacterium]
MYTPIVKNAVAAASAVLCLAGGTQALAQESFEPESDAPSTVVVSATPIADFLKDLSLSPIEPDPQGARPVAIEYSDA